MYNLKKLSKHSVPWLCSSCNKGNCLFQEKKKSKSKGESKESSEAATESSQDKQEKIEGKAYRYVGSHWIVMDSLID